MDAGFAVAHACDSVDVAVSKYGSAHWLTNYAFGSHAADWLAVAAVAVLVLAIPIGTRRFIFWLLSHKRDSDKSEREYWRIHGGE
jgi:hypothetical protein